MTIEKDEQPTVRSGMGSVTETAPAYLTAYGLQRDPFSEDIENDFFYGDSDRTQRINLMTHLAPFGGVILVNGVRGVGKTTLMKQFLARAKESWRISQFDAGPDKDADAWIKTIFESFSFNAALKTDSHALNGLQEQLFSLHRNGLAPIIIIDDAHLLSDSVLQVLFTLTGPVSDDPDEACVTVILFCEPSIVDNLFSPELQAMRGRIKHSFELTNYSEEKTRKYISHRLRVAGLVGEGPFSPSVMKVIYSKSNGLPEKINELARVILTSSVDTSDNEPGKPLFSGLSFSGKRVWLPVVAVAVLTLVLVFQDRINRLFDTVPKTGQIKPATIKESVPDNETVKPIEMLREIKPAGQPVVTSNDNVEIISLPDPVQKELKTHPVNTAKENKNKESEIPIALQQLLADKRKEFSGIMPGKNTRQEPVQAPVITEPVVKEVVVPVMSRAKPAPVPEPVSAPVPVAKPPSVAEPDDVQDSKVNQVQSVVAVGARIIEEKKAEPDKITQQAHREEWLMTRSAKHYTLQLMANDEEVVIRFIKQKGLLSDAAYFHTLSKGKPLYALVLGDYETLAAAKAASQSLPPALGKVQPWIRSFDSVQAAIRTYRKQMPPVNQPVVGSADLSDQQPTAVRSEGENWILAQPSDSYTLQLTAMNSEAAVREYIQTHGIGQKSAYFRKTDQETTWYSVVYGSYAARDEALAASKSLPRSLGKISPWVRSFGSIQTVMKGE